MNSLTWKCSFLTSLETGRTAVLLDVSFYLAPRVHTVSSTIVVSTGVNGALIRILNITIKPSPDDKRHNGYYWTPVDIWN